MSRRTVYKYDVPVAGEFSLKLPLGYKVLCIKVQKKKPVLYIEVNPDAVTHGIVHFWVIGTGQIIPNIQSEYVGTFLMNDDTLVFHIYKR